MSSRNPNNQPRRRTTSGDLSPARNRSAGASPRRPCAVADEMHTTSQQFEDKLWRRLQAISVEDVGFGDLSAPVLINALNQMRQNFPYTDGDRPIFFVHAIRYLAAAKKDRTSDNLKNIVKTEFEYGRQPVIPDFALDMHTEKGRAMGRDFKHFLAEGSRVENELQVDENYKARSAGTAGQNRTRGSRKGGRRLCLQFLAGISQAQPHCESGSAVNMTR